MLSKSDQLLSFLLSEDDNSGLDAPNISDAENDATDLKDSDDVNADSKDNKEDSKSDEDVDNENDSNEEEPADTPDNSESDTDTNNLNSENDSEDGDGTDDSESVDEEDTPEIIRKKLTVYSNLEQLKLSYSSLNDIYDKFSLADEAPLNQKVFIMLSNKIKFNLESIENLIYSPSVIKDYSYPELLALYNVYMSDLRAVRDNLKLVLKIYQERSEKSLRDARRNLK